MNSLYDSINDLLIKKSKGYESYVVFVNELHKSGLSKHACMVLDLIVIGRNPERIRNVLLFTQEHFDEVLTEIHETLERFVPKRRAISFLPKFLKNQ